MSNLRLNEVHIGEAIKKRLEKLQMSKTEFGKRIGTPQQHVNRILERDTMETKKLIKVCKALDFNFFTLFCESQNSIYAYLSAIALGEGNASLNMGDAATIAELEKKIARIETLEAENQLLRDQINTLNDNLATKQELIDVLRNNK